MGIMNFPYQMAIHTGVLLFFLNSQLLFLRLTFTGYFTQMKEEPSLKWPQWDSIHLK